MQKSPTRSTFSKLSTAATLALGMALSPSAEASPTEPNEADKICETVLAATTNNCDPAYAERKEAFHKTFNELAESIWKNIDFSTYKTQEEAATAFFMALAKSLDQQFEDVCYDIHGLSASFDVSQKTSSAIVSFSGKARIETAATYNTQDGSKEIKAYMLASRDLCPQEQPTFTPKTESRVGDNMKNFPR